MTAPRNSPQLSLAVDNSAHETPLHGAIRRWRLDRRQLEHELVNDASGVSHALALLASLLPARDAGLD